jgi:hypothetical protein
MLTQEIFEVKADKFELVIISISGIYTQKYSIVELFTCGPAPS